MSISPDLLGAVLAFSAALFLAIGILLVRKATVTDDPMYGVFAASAVGLAIYLPLAGIFHFPFDGFSPPYLAVFIPSGTIGLVLARTCYYNGVERIGAAWTAPIKNASLIISSVIGIAFLSESVTIGHLAGISLITLGVIFIGREIASEGNDSNLNVKSYLELLFPFGAMLFFGLSGPINKIGLANGIPVLIGLAVMHASALAIITVYFSWTGRSVLYPFQADTKYLYLGAGLSLSVGIWLIFWALKISPVVVVIPLKSTSPFFVLLMSYVFLRDLERVTKILVIGSTAIVIGAALIGGFM